MSASATLVIRNGTITDGSGSDPIQADLAVTVVSAAVAYRNGEPTGALLGRLVCGPKAIRPACASK